MVHALCSTGRTEPQINAVTCLSTEGPGNGFWRRPLLSLSVSCDVYSIACLVAVGSSSRQTFRTGHGIITQTNG